MPRVRFVRGRVSCIQFANGKITLKLDEVLNDASAPYIELLDGPGDLQARSLGSGNELYVRRYVVC